MIFQKGITINNLKYITTLLYLLNFSYADSTTIQMTYENFDFENSKKKDDGKRYGMVLSHKTENANYQLAYDKTNTNTFQPPLPSDLHVNKYYLKYTHKLDNKQYISFNYATIDDNLMEAVDGGHIYGFGYKYGAFGLTQYISDYNQFNVYQTDIEYMFKKRFGELFVGAKVLAKYIHIKDKDSNNFSKNAKEDYLTPGFKLHAHYKSYHMGAGAYFGKRVFAVMKDGLKVQHHAMEFNKTYMIGVGKHFNDLDITVKYVYQEATEIPIHNQNVKVDNFILQVGYRF